MYIILKYVTKYLFGTNMEPNHMGHFHRCMYFNVHE